MKFILNRSKVANDSRLLGGIHECIYVVRFLFSEAKSRFLYFSFYLELLDNFHFHRLPEESVRLAPTATVLYVSYVLLALGHVRLGFQLSGLLCFEEIRGFTFASCLGDGIRDERLPIRSDSSGAHPLPGHLPRHLLIPHQGQPFPEYNALPSPPSPPSYPSLPHHLLPPSFPRFVSASL